MKHVEWRGGGGYSRIFNSGPGFEKKKGVGPKDMKHIKIFCLSMAAIDT